MGAALFVYGTLRPAFDGDMARWLAGAARWMGPASIGGMLYRVADYPGFVPGAAGRVAGDLFALADAAAVLARLDAYEACAPDSPEPHEYRRTLLPVDTPTGLVDAWVYVYALSVTGHEVIDGGDFLALVGPGRRFS